MMALLGELREDLHYQVGDTTTKVSDERFFDIQESLLKSSYFIELCLFRSRFGDTISPNDVRKQVGEDILNVLGSLSNRQEVFTLVGMSTKI